MYTTDEIILGIGVFLIGMIAGHLVDKFLPRQDLPFDAPVDEEDAKRINDECGVVLTTIINHIATVFSWTGDLSNQMSKTYDGLDSTAFLISGDDGIEAHINIFWHRKCVIQFTRDDNGTIITMRKTFYFKHNTMPLNKLTKFCYKFIKKACPEMADLQAYILGAKQVVDKITDADALDVLMHLATEFNEQNYKNLDLAHADYQKLLVYVLKYHYDEFLNFLESK